MNCNKIIKNMIWACVLLVTAFCLSPQTAGAGCDCDKDTATPPFLAAGADPNLLLMIDNSASMYDLAYADTAAGSSLCFDETFDPDRIKTDPDTGDPVIDPVTGNPVPLPYVGYFEENTWYSYNLDPATDRFQVAADGACAGGTVYSSADVCIALTGDVVDDFRATGDFLNWATASKYDIEKKILTGGKYDAVNGVMESEGRGCTGNRFIKQVAVTNGGTTYQLVLGVRTDEDRDDGIDTTLIDIFPVTVDGFEPAACQAAIDIMMGPPTGFGQVLQNVIDCMEYDVNEQHQQGGEHDKQALIHSLHDCWYLDKHGDWPSGSAQGFNFENWCTDVYTRIDPRELTKDDPAYVCFGDGTDDDLTEGFIGECYTPPGDCHDVLCTERVDLEDRERCGDDGFIEYCTDWNTGKDECKKEDDWVVVVDCDGGGAVGDWKWAVNSDELDACITAARERFCGYIETPQVIDPSDLQTSTGETWNLPAMLMDHGAVGQVGLPLATARGIIERDEAPDGLLQEFSSQIRIGAMAFNHDGAGTASEFTGLASYIYYDPGIDGASVIHPIGSDVETAGHTDGLVAAINDKHATTWTPLAEAMLTAIGYYTQDLTKELNPGIDFSMYGAPITYWCQSNNVLFITDGASTADLNEKIDDYTGDPDGTDVSTGFGDLFGSTYFDDLAYYGRQEDIFTVDLGLDGDPKNINTFVVFTGDKEDGDDASDDETNPYVLMREAVEQGGPNALESDPEDRDQVLMGQSPQDLSDALREAFRSILKRAAAGSAASVISATRGGEGAVYQAIFWPGIEGPTYSDNTKLPDVTWAGEVHSLLVDAEGSLFEDTDGDKALTDTDEHVVFFFDENSDPVETKACYGDVTDGVCGGTSKSLHEVAYLWSASEWLSGIDAGGVAPDIDSNRNNYISSEHKRYIFTWNDLNNDGAVTTAAPNEVIAFEPATDWSSYSALVDASRGDLPYDFGVDPTAKTLAEIDAEVDGLVSWVRGKDAAGYRSREVDTPANFDIPAGVESTEGTVTWRLGDVVHSTPTSVSRPAENYHLMYRDDTYVDFVKQYADRRHVIYFGGNDGMIHAINGGFYDSDSSGFCLADGCPEGVVDAPALGAELWAYVPYNLQPQLKCLADPDYMHRYYVDLKPRVFDVRIFADDADHPNGWGTILVAGMRFGGASVDADAAGDARKFVSSYVIMDVTNPEEPPDLLGELTYDMATGTHMGYTTLVPAVVPMKEGDLTKWYLILGSGPLVLDAAGEWVHDVALQGVSNKQAKVGIFPLAELTSGGAFRIPNSLPGADTAGRYLLPNVGFVSDPISVDFDLSPNYRADAVYFGTVEGNWWSGWSGKFYRMVTNADAAITGPNAWTAPAMMFNPERPVTAAPNVGWDGDNFWVYFGTGRFFHKWDKTNASSNAQETYYGLKEPINCLTGFTWSEVLKSDLVRSDQILVTEADEPEDALLSCVGGGTGCLPTGVTNFEELELYVAGDGCSDDTPPQPTGEAGWYREFDLDRERNLGQATLLGGLVTFTTYQPFDDICRPEGEAYLYAVYYKTGTAWYQAVFSDPWGSSGDPPQVVDKLDIGRGLATTPNLHVGRQDGSKAFAQTSTGAIVEIEQPNLPLKAAKTGRMYWRVD